MSQQLQVAIYDVWDCSRTRVSIPGIAMMPLAGSPPQPSIPIVLDGGTDVEVIQFIAGRWGALPEVPAPTTTNPNRIFLGGSQFGGFPIVSAGSFNFYRIGGVYVFGILNPEGLLGDFMLGAAPMPNQPVPSLEVMPGTNFRQDLVNQQSTPQLGSITLGKVYVSH